MRWWGCRTPTKEKVDVHFKLSSAEDLTSIIYLYWDVEIMDV
jgi:hypothetical protein